MKLPTMKLSSALSYLVLAVGVSVSSAGSDTVRSNVVRTTGTPVDIGIECVGLDLKTIDSVSATILGQVLEESFDQVVKKDTSLSYNNFMKVDSDQNPSWRCGRLCPDDDALVADETNVANQQDGFMLNGYWNCGLGAGDGNCFDSVLASGGLRGPVMKEQSGLMSKWGKELVSLMMKTRRNAFRTVEECSITVKPSTANLEKSL
jgi:hypothetical protein